MEKPVAFLAARVVGRILARAFDRIDALSL